MMDTHDSLGRRKGAHLGGAVGGERGGDEEHLDSWPEQWTPSLSSPLGKAKTLAKSRSTPRLVVRPPHPTEDSPFSPTHTSPTASTSSSSQLAPNLRQSSSSTSLFASFRALHLQNDSLGTSSHSASVPLDAPRSISPRPNLPSIRTSFTEQAHTTPSLSASPTSYSTLNHAGDASRHWSPGNSVRPRGAHPSVTAFYDSPLTSTTTPSSIGQHQMCHFSPALQHADLLARSPATSVGGSDFQHGHTGKRQQSGEVHESQPYDWQAEQSSRGWVTGWPGPLGGSVVERRVPCMSPSKLAERLAYDADAAPIRHLGTSPRAKASPKSRPAFWGPSTSELLQQSAAKADESNQAVSNARKENLDVQDFNALNGAHLDSLAVGSGSETKGEDASGAIGFSIAALSPTRAWDRAIEGVDRGAPSFLPLFASQRPELLQPPSSPSLAAGSPADDRASGPELAVERKESAFSSGASSSTPPRPAGRPPRARRPPSSATPAFPGLSASLQRSALQPLNTPLQDDTASAAAVTATGRPVRKRRAGHGRVADTDSYPSTPLIILYITTNQRSVGRDTVLTLNRFAAIHIDVPAALVRRHCQGTGSCLDFEHLDAFLVDDMSKRRYSRISMDDSGATSVAYWARDILIVADQNDYGVDHSVSTNPAASGLTSVAAQIFANAVCELASGSEAKGCLSFLEGGIMGLQSVQQAEQRQIASPSYSDGILTVEPALLTPPSTSPKTPTRSRRAGTLRPVRSLTLSPLLDAATSPPALRTDEETARLSPPPITPLALSSLASPAPAPSRTTRSARPMLTRLDTSEKVKKVVNPTHASRESDESPRLALNTTLAPCSTSLLSAAPVAGNEAGLPSLEARNLPSAARIPSSQARDLRRGSEPGGLEERTMSTMAKSLQSPHSPTRSFSLSSGTAVTDSFEPSEILSNFLYLGPDISTVSEVNYLKNQWGIKRILNAAWEIEDGGGRHLNLQSEAMSGIERYKKLPLKDTVEAKGVQRFIDEACAFLDDARLHSAPVYVHCKAGKSRSVMLVMAYLIHANRWTLQKSYSYVVERRRTVSPNIGFVAELMAFEERKLQANKATAGPAKAEKRGHAGETTAPQGAEMGREEDDGSTDALSMVKKANRESLPTSIALSLAPLPFWEHMQKRAGIQGRDNDRLNENDPASASTTPRMATMISSGEYRGTDGRYYAKRPPADEKLLAPNRRATLAAVDSENIFGAVSRTQEG